MPSLYNGSGLGRNVRWFALLFALALGAIVLRRQQGPRQASRLVSHAKASSQLPAHTRVIVASCFIMHEDVWLPIVKDIQDVVSYSNGQYYPDALRVYAHPFPFGFSKIVNQLGLFNGQVHPWESLIHTVEHTRMSGMNGEGFVDLIVLGTCVFDINEYTDGLIAIWDQRPVDQKFSIVCIGHGVDELDKWKAHLDRWVRRRSIRILAISEHVAEGYRNAFRAFADSPDEETFLAGYEYVTVDSYAPVLDLPDPGRNSLEQEAKGLSRVVIQGSMESARRDYARVLNDLVESLQEDPHAWGYLPLISTTDTTVRLAYQPDPDSRLEPLVLHLVGRGGDGPGGIEIPQVLLPHVVNVHRDLDYDSFYDLMHSMDICLLSFITDAYYQDRASSTFAMALETHVPLLVTNRTRKAYLYASDERVTVIRPQGLREVEAIKALRTSYWDPSRPNAPRADGKDALGGQEGLVRSDIIGGELRSRVEQMQKLGWTRSDAGFREVKEKVWASNSAVVNNILGVGC